MKTILLLCAGLWLLFCVPKCHALQSKELVSYCQAAKKATQVMTNDEMIQWQFCNGYIQGIIDAIDSRQNEVDPRNGHKLHKQWLCIPDGVDTIEIALVYIKHMDEHPEELHEAALNTLWNVVIATYRCTAGTTATQAPH